MREGRWDARFAGPERVKELAPVMTGRVRGFWTKTLTRGVLLATGQIERVPVRTTAPVRVRPHVVDVVVVPHGDAIDALKPNGDSASRSRCSRLAITSTPKRVFSNSQSHRADRSNEDVSSALTPISDGVTSPPRVFRRSFASMRSSIDFARFSAPISAWALRPRFSFIFGLLVSASSVSSAFLPSSVDASTVTAFFVAACVSVWDEWWVWGSAPRVDPVELARCFRAGHLDCAMASCSAQPREGAPGRRSRPLGPALSAPLPGDFRPVIVSVLEKRSRPRSSPKRASAPPRANREIRGDPEGGVPKSPPRVTLRAPHLGFATVLIEGMPHGEAPVG